MGFSCRVAWYALPLGQPGMQCLYRGDYGPPDPAFQPDANGGVLLRGFESDRAILIHAQNLGQLYAIKGQLARGEHIQWYDQGYGWT
jgi:hypothetical protein